MRQITRDSINAFYNNEPFKRDNTSVVVHDTHTDLRLHGNLIASKERNKVWISTAGWNTRTTLERLNGLHNVSVCIKKGQLYLNNNQWDGDITRVTI